MAKGMARKPKPAIPRREVAVDRDSWLGRVRLLALKNMLGLGLTAEEEAFLGPMPRFAVFTPEEVIDLLGDGAKGIPRMLPVDEALGRLGMPIVRARPDGTAERLTKEFPKALGRQGQGGPGDRAPCGEDLRGGPEGLVSRSRAADDGRRR
jgi:hypothetical protein